MRRKVTFFVDDCLDRDPVSLILVALKKNMMTAIDRKRLEEFRVLFDCVSNARVEGVDDED